MKVSAATLLSLLLLCCCGVGFVLGTEFEAGQTSLLSSPLVAAQLSAGDGFGSSVADLRWDLDGNGADELVVRASGDDDGGADQGALYVLFMSASGYSVIGVQKISALAGNFTGNLSTAYTLQTWGGALQGIGDLDGDGNGDLAVGTSRAPSGGNQRGMVQILFLNADGTVREHVEHPAPFAELGENSRFGTSILNIGDRNGDSVPDLAVGAERAELNGCTPFCGAVVVLFMRRDGTYSGLTTISHGLGGLPTVLLPGNRFGSSLELAGDLDGDSFDDLVVGAWYDDDLADRVGAAFTLFLTTDNTANVASYAKISATAGNFPSGLLEVRDEFGLSVTNLGSIDGDASPEMAVSAPSDDDGGDSLGAVYIVSYTSVGIAGNVSKISSTEGNMCENLTGHNIGNDLVSLGVRDGSGFPTVALSAPGAGTAGDVWLWQVTPLGAGSVCVPGTTGTTGTTGSTSSTTGGGSSTTAGSASSSSSSSSLTTGGGTTTTASASPAPPPLAPSPSPSPPASGDAASSSAAPGGGEFPWLIVTVAAGALCCCLLLLVAVALVVMRRRKKKQEDDGVEFSSYTGSGDAVETAYVGMPRGAAGGGDGGDDDDDEEEVLIYDTLAGFQLDAGDAAYTAASDVAAQDHYARIPDVDAVTGTYAKIPKFASSVKTLSASEVLVDESSKLGEGEYGIVLLGQVAGVHVAVKAVKGEADDDAVREAYREAELLSGIPSHPHVVGFLGCTPDPFLIVTELCEGGSLQKFLRRKTTALSREQELKIIRDIADGMAHLAANKVVHRDLAVRNVLLSPSEDGIPVPKICDFGMSRKLEESMAQGHSKSLVGPVRWMAPETIRKGIYSEKSDVWAFGVLAWEVFNRGSAPYRKVAVMEVARLVIAGELRPEFPDSLPSSIEGILDECCQMKPESRPSFRQLRKTFDAADDDDEDPIYASLSSFAQVPGGLRD